MNIKSLLLGSAAAMVAVSGAQAADAIVVEPEPVEYVRVCDAYGTGFFFIPGTERCIRFSGYVRTQYTKLDVDNDAGTARYENTRWSTRSRFDVDVRNESDWGTVRSLIRLQSNNAYDDNANGVAAGPPAAATVNSNFEVDQAIISVGGFRAGIGGSLYNANFAAGMNLEGVPELFEDGVYGFSNAHVLDYTFAADGLAISVGIEESNGIDASDATGLVKVQYSADFGTVGIVAEFNTGTANDSYKAYATLDLSDFLPGGVLGGYYIWQDDITGTNTTAARMNGADNVYGIGLQMNLADNLEFVAFHNSLDYANSALEDNLTTLALNWYPVDGLKVFTAYSFGESHAVNGAFVGGQASVANGFTADENVDFDQFLIGLRRNF